MKDYLNKHKWVNNPIKNPFTLATNRFQRQPWGLLKTPFTQDRLKFDDRMNTVYTEILE